MLILLAGVAVAAVLLWPDSDADEDEVTVSSVSGQAQVRDGPDGQFEPLEVDSTIPEECLIQTGPDGSVTLERGDGTLELDANSELSCAIDEETDQRRIVLTRGTATADAFATADLAFAAQQFEVVPGDDGVVRVDCQPNALCVVENSGDDPVDVVGADGTATAVEPDDPTRVGPEGGVKGPLDGTWGFTIEGSVPELWSQWQPDREQFAVMFDLASAVSNSWEGEVQIDGETVAVGDRVDIGDTVITLLTPPGSQCTGSSGSTTLAEQAADFDLEITEVRGGLATRMEGTVTFDVEVLEQTCGTEPLTAPDGSPWPPNGSYGPVEFDVSVLIDGEA